MRAIRFMQTGLPRARTFCENWRGMGIGWTSAGRTGLKYFLFLYLSAIQTSITARDAFSSGTENPAGRLPSQIARALALPTVFIVCAARGWGMGLSTKSPAADLAGRILPAGAGAHTHTRAARACLCWRGELRSFGMLFAFLETRRGRRLTSIWSGNHASMVMLRTWVMCVPSERWTPEQFRQRYTPRLALAQVGSAHPNGVRDINTMRARGTALTLGNIRGSVGAGSRRRCSPRMAQSAQNEFSGNLTKSCRILWWILSSERA